MLDLFLNYPSLISFLDDIKKRNQINFPIKGTSEKALILALVHHYLGKDICCVTSQEVISEIEGAFSFFTKVSPLVLKEEIEFSFFKEDDHQFTQHLELLYSLQNNKHPTFLLTTFEGLHTRFPERHHLDNLQLELEVKKTISLDHIVTTLNEWGYTSTSLTTQPGHFSKRGGLLDIYPQEKSFPFRIEFWADEIESIRSFHPLTQRSIDLVEKITLFPLKNTSKQPLSSSLFSYLHPETFFFFDHISQEDLFPFKSDIPKKNTFFFSSDSSSSFFIKDFGSWLTPLTTSFHNLSIQELFQALLSTIPQYHLNFVTSSHAEHNILKQQLHDKEHISYHQGDLYNSFVIEPEKQVWISYTQLQKRKSIKKKAQHNIHPTTSLEYQQLKIGDYVVHIHFGIGKFLGIEQKKNYEGILSEFLHIEYADNSSLFVPIFNSHLVNKYIGAHEDDIPSLNKLGTTSWEKTKRQAEASILAYAADLVQLYAKRSLDKILPYKDDSDDLALIENSFPYQETQDQLQAISDIKRDLQSSCPMDRLICGDAGFGKTEVGLRAALKTVIDGHKQVAFLVPTTVLAMQHYDYFKERIGDFPIQVGLLSRMQTAKETSAILKALKAGHIDIVVGTHKILSDSLEFKDLGLLLIDEEQRFGVDAKEKLKKLKTNLHCLTLSATPIPRTLHMSLMGLRDLSLLTTPPIDRLPIQSIVKEISDRLIQEAIDHELKRKGQVFIIHNEVSTLKTFAAYIQKLVPYASLGIGHGQMQGQDLDDVFHKFKQGHLDVFIATTIVESGIDVPNANTIIINRADRFGLAELYQLKGRVGRSNKQAFAFFLIPSGGLQALTKKSRQRLESLMEIKGLGGGMQLAMKDLEIRGAGNLLGQQQSGHLASLGFHFYCKMLKQAIAALEGKRVPSFKEVKISLPFEAYFPDHYIEDESLRMQLYQQLGQSLTTEEVDGLFDEIKDRFGKPPQEAVYLYHAMRLQVIASAFHIHLIEIGKVSVVFHQLKGKNKVERRLLTKIPTSPLEMEKLIIKLMEKEFK